jgi:excisionase family DNA binding protein
VSDRLAAAVAELVDALRAELTADAREAGPDRLLSVEEAAERLGLGRSATYGLLAAGRLRSFRVGRRRLVPASAVDAFIEASAA